MQPQTYRQNNGVLKKAEVDWNDIEKRKAGISLGTGVTWEWAEFDLKEVAVDARTNA